MPRAIGQHARESHPDGRTTYMASFQDLGLREPLLAALDDAAALPAFRSVLVKGSRFMAMERVVRALASPAEASHAV